MRLVVPLKPGCGVSAWWSTWMPAPMLTSVVPPSTDDQIGVPPTITNSVAALAGTVPAAVKGATKRTLLYQPCPPRKFVVLRTAHVCPPSGERKSPRVVTPPGGVVLLSLPTTDA